jgi:putative inorganic carbon (HCO3(-)) transporter
MPRAGPGRRSGVFAQVGCRIIVEPPQVPPSGHRSPTTDRDVKPAFPTSWPPGRSDGSDGHALPPRVLTFGIVITVTAAIAAGIARADGGSRAGFVLPVVIAIGLGLAYLAFTRFELFLVAILASRASLDALKLGSSGATGGGAFDPAAMLSVAFLFAGLLWMAAQSREPLAPTSPMVKPMAALVLAGAVSVVVSPNITGAAVDLLKLSTVVVILVVLNQLFVQARAVRMVLAAVVVSSIVPMLGAAYQFVSGTGLHTSGSFTRVQGTFTHPNPFAIYLTLLIVMGVAVLRYLSPVRKLALLVFMGGWGVCLLLTYTRSAWIATVAGVLTVGLYQGKKVIAIFGLIIVVLVLTVPSTGARFADLEQGQTSTGAPGNSLVWRFDYWRQAIDLNNDPLLGNGLRSVKETTDAAKEPHNDFIRVFVETGLIGLAAYVWFLLTLWRTGKRAIHGTADGLLRGVAVGFFGCVVSFLLLSIVSNVITQLVILWYFAAFVAAAVAAPRLAPAPDPADLEASLQGAVPAG